MAWRPISSLVSSMVSGLLSLLSGPALASKIQNLASSMGAVASDTLSLLRRHPKTFLTALLFAVIAVYVHHELSLSVIIIDAFSVPRILADQGVTGVVVSGEIADAALNIEQTDRSIGNAASMTDELRLSPEPPLPDIEVLGTKLSPRGLILFVQALLNSEPPRLTGEIVCLNQNCSGWDQQRTPTANEDVLKVTYRMVRGPNEILSEQFLASDLDSAVKRLAGSLLANTNPYLLGRYKTNVEHDNKSAVELFRRCIAACTNPMQRAGAYNDLGLLVEKQGGATEAIELYRKAAELAPQNSVVYANWAYVLLRTEDVVGADAKIRRAISLPPVTATTYMLQAEILKSQRDFAGATAALNNAVRVDPQRDAAYGNLGAVLNDQKRYDEAIISFKKAIELNPNEAIHYYNLGLALQSLGQRDEEAAKMYEKALSLDQIMPATSLAYSNWGTILANSGRYLEAEAKYRRAIEIDPSNELAHLNLGRTLTATRDFVEADREFARAYELKAENAEILFYWSESLLAQGKLDESSDILKRAMEIDPSISDEMRDPQHHKIGDAIQH